MHIAKTKLIVCEGPDASGKTMLAKLIATRYGYNYLHHSGDKSLHTGMDAYHSGILKDVTFNINNGHGFVLDRCWISEWVYGKVFKRPEVDSFPFTKISCGMHELGVKYIYCRSSLDQFLKDEKDRHGYTIHDFANIMQEYFEFFDCNMYPIVEYTIEEWGYRMNEFCVKHLDHEHK